MISFKKIVNQLKWWQQIIVILIGLYILKELFNILKVSNMINTTQTTESFKQESGQTLNCTMYYAPWCGHCKTAKPEWQKLEDAYHGKIINGTQINITKIDCDENPEIAQKENIEGFPTFKFEMNGKKHDYNGDRTLNGWKQHIQSIIGSD